MKTPHLHKHQFLVLKLLCLLLITSTSCEHIRDVFNIKQNKYKYKEIGGLYFKAKKFAESSSDITATGNVWVGFPPDSTGGDFVPLLSISNGIDITKGSDPSFSTTSQISMSVQSTTIPLFNNGITLDINNLINTGITLSGAESFDVHGLVFELSSLALADSTGLGTLVKLQGALSVDKLDSLQVDVKDNNYVIVNKNGVGLTGLNVSLNATDTFKLADVTFLPESFNFQFESSDSTYEISGTGEIIADSDTISIKLGDDTTPGLEIKDGHIADFDMTVSQDKTFGLKGVEFDPEVLNLTYKKVHSTFSMYGDLKAIVESDTINIDAGSRNAPGLEITNGAIDEINFSVTQDKNFSLFGLDIDPKSLSFKYEKSSSGDEYEIAGDLQIKVGTDTVDVNMKELKIQNGSIDTLCISFTDSLSLGGLVLQTKDLTLSYARDNSRYEITGLITIPELFHATVGFPGKGIDIIDGKWELEGFKFEVEDVNLDVFEVKDLKVLYEKTSTSYDLDISLFLQFPGGFGAGGSIEFQNGHIKELGINVNDIIAVGDSGLALYTMGAKVDNLDAPRNLVVSGDLGLTIEGAEIDTLFLKVYSSFTADRESLSITGEAQMSLDVEGTVTVTVNWQDGIYTISTDWVLYEIFDIDLGFSINDSLFVTMLGEVDLVIPNEIPIIGGDTLVDAGFYFQRHIETPVKESDDFAAGWGSILWSEAGIKVPFKDPKDFKIIGSKQINGIKHHHSQEGTTYHYTAIANVPEGATHMILHANWPEDIDDQQISVTLPNDTTILAADFSEANGVYLDHAHTDSRRATILIRNPPPDTMKYDPIPHGQYQFHLSTSTEFPGDTVSLHSRYFIPKPSLSIDSISVPEGDSIAIVYYTPQSTSMGEEVEVKLFIDNDATGYDGAYMNGKNYSPQSFLIDTKQPDSLVIDIGGILPLDYYIYGIIKDQINIPDTSGYSASFLPKPSLFGTVNKEATGEVLSGIHVYLIEKTNNDTSYVFTNSDGVYAFYNLTPSNYIVGITPPEGYIPENLHIQDTVTIEKDKSKVVDFQLIELATISGVVYLDTNGNGIKDNSEQGIFGQPISLDMNISSQAPDTLLTNTSGEYTFYSVPKGKGEVNIIITEDYFQVKQDTAAYPVNIINDTLQATHINDRDFGLIEKIKISGMAFDDWNGDGKPQKYLDDHEGDRNVTLIRDDGQTLNAVTNSHTGIYQFTDTVLSANYQLMMPDIESQYYNFTGKNTAASFSMQPTGLPYILHDVSDPLKIMPLDLNNDHQLDHIGYPNLSDSFEGPSTLLVNKWSTQQVAADANTMVIGTGLPIIGNLVEMDINQDGYQDFGTFVGISDTTSVLVLGEGSRDTITKKQFSSIDNPANWNYLFTLNYDSISPPDILGFIPESGNLTVQDFYYEGGTYVFDPTVHPPLTTPQIIEYSTTGNFIGSALNDIVLLLENGDLYLIENKGNREFGKGIIIGQVQSISDYEGYPYMYTTDLNQDNKDDIIVAADSIFYLLNSGLGNFTEPKFISEIGSIEESFMGFVATPVAITDMDHNSYPDILISYPDTVYIFLNQSDSSLDPNHIQFDKTNAPVPGLAQPFSITPMDMNADGLPDLLCSFSADSFFYNILNTTTFASYYEFEAKTGNTYEGLNFPMQSANVDNAPIAPAPIDTLKIGAGSKPLPQGDRWVAGNMVRYAYSVKDLNPQESPIGPWTEWKKFTDALPELTDIPKVGSDIEWRTIYRQFWRHDQLPHAGPIQAVGILFDGNVTTFQDTIK